MKLTKYEHACVIIEELGSKLVIDPGDYTDLPEDLDSVVAIVITHEHADHFSLRQIEKIRQSSPDAAVYSTENVVSKTDNANHVTSGEKVSVGAFELEFYGNKHEKARDDIPQVENIGVVVNEKVAYSGDSYEIPPKRIGVLLAPASAPWLHIQAAYDYISSVKAKQVIPTHDSLLSDIGQQVFDKHLRAACEQSGKTFRRLAVGETIELIR